MHDPIGLDSLDTLLVVVETLCALLGGEYYTVLALCEVAALGTGN